MPPNTQQELEQRYYLAHFHEMLTFIEEHMDALLEEEHRQWIDDFIALPDDAQCLYVRFANRKGIAFEQSKLRYDEIASISESLETLSTSKFVHRPTEADWSALLSIQTRPHLMAIAKTKLPSSIASSTKKAELIERLQEELTFSDCFHESEHHRYIIQSRIEPLDYLFFLYYGRLSTGLTALALRDLGILQQGPSKQTFRPRFASREAAQAAFTLRHITHTLDSADSQQILQLASSVSEWPKVDDPESLALYHRAVYRVGRELERADQPREALRVYQHSDEHPATERNVRLLLQMNEREQAEADLLRMIDQPSCDIELIFAEDFYQRKFQKKKVGRLTETLRQASVFQVDETYRDQPELGVVSVLSRRGEAAYHSENTIWNQLFGLLFWDLLFEENAPIHNEFERKPWGLDTGEFFKSNRAEIESRLDLLNQSDRALAYLQKTWQIHEGIPNALVEWLPESLTPLTWLVSFAPPTGLRAMMLCMAKSHRAHRNGYPDLIVKRGDDIRFIEVKTEGDRISRTQLTRMEQLKKHGFAVEVAAVKWAFDPDQEYVVVDVETTGINPKWNRITEIGAVKVRGDQIVGEWSSLINPERSIPRNITTLTGITTEMVADAPRFEDIADSFRAFLGDSIFVAHRASFDFGFIKAEYERLDQAFQCPTFCTVVNAKRVFPGLPSYGLSPLCQHFGIALDSHHRALCDAKATAEILIQINQKRANENAAAPE